MRTAIAPAPPRADFADRLLRELEASGIRVCAVGDTDGFPQSIPSDLDLVVGDDDSTRLPRFLMACAEANDAQLVQRLWHERTAWYFVVAGFGADGQPWFLHPDFSCGYCEKGRDLLTARQLLHEARAAGDAQGVPRGFFVPAPACEFIYYLVKKIEKQDLRADHGRHLSRIFARDPAGTLDELNRFWSPRRTQAIAAAGASGDWTEIRNILPQLQRELHRSAPRSWVRLLRELPRWTDRMRRPTGLWVVFLGPDGVGKSTLVRRVVADLSPAFRRTRSCHFRADVIADPDGRGAITDPHGRRPHGVAASLAQLALHLARNCIGYWTIVRPALTRSTLVAFDRYYHDILVDPRRYRYGGPRWLSAVIAALVPRPDLWIVLDAPTPAIAARKYELPPAEIERQAHAYRALARGLDGGQIIDAARPVTSVAHDVERLILAHMAARTTRRLAPVPAS